jgi:recombination protein RecA
LLFSKGDCYDKDGKEQPKSYAFPVAHKVVMSLNKTKICPPDRKLTYYTLRYEKGKEGVDYFSDTVDLAIDCGVIEKSGAWYSYKDLKVQGVEKVKNYFRNNDDDFMEVYETIMEIVKK